MDQAEKKITELSLARGCLPGCTSVEARSAAECLGLEPIAPGWNIFIPNGKLASVSAAASMYMSSKSSRSSYQKCGGGDYFSASLET